MENGGWKRKMGAGVWCVVVCGVWCVVLGVWCGVCGVWWWVVVCGNGSGGTDPVTPDVLGSTVADNDMMARECS